jgi:hypothetical protein
MPRNWGYPGAGGEMRDGITPELDKISYSYFSISEHNCKKIMAGPFYARSRSDSGVNITYFIHELFKKDDNAMIYLIKLKSPKKQSVFCTGWKACATRFFAAW